MRTVLSAILLALCVASAEAQIIGGGVLSGGGGNLPAKFQPALWLDASDGYCWQDAAAGFVAADKSHLAMGTNWNPGTKDIGISLWVYADTSTATMTLFCTGGTTDGQDGVVIQLDSSGNVIVGFNDSVKTARLTATYTTALADDTWYHLFWHCDRSGLARLYVNGVADDVTLDISAHNASLGASLGNFGAANASNLYFDGRLDSFMTFELADMSSVVADLVAWCYNSGAGRLGEDITDAQKTAWGAVSCWDLSGSPWSDSWGSNDLTFSASPIISPTVYGSELLTNGNLDSWASDTNLNSWNESNLGTGAIAREATDVHTAAGNALKITTGDNANIREYFDTATLAAGAYRLSFWTHGDGTNGSRYRVYGSSGGDIVGVANSNVTGTNYTLVTVDFTNPQSQVIEIFLYGNATSGAVVYFDDISLKAITTAAVNNGGFESWTVPSNADSWTESVSGSSLIYREDAAPYSGSHALAMQVDSSNSLAGISNVLLTSGKLYSYSLYSKAASGTPTIKLGDSSTYQNSHTLTTSYAAYSGSFRSTVTTFSIARNSATSNTIYLDSVTLTAAELLPVAGIVRGKSTDEGDVSYWMDRSGNGKHAEVLVYAQYPEYETTGPNGRPTVVFDGVDDRLPTTLQGWTAATVFVVFKGGLAGDGIFGINDSNIQIAAGPVIAGQVASHDSSVVVSNEDPTSQYQVACLTYGGNGEAEALYVDGVEEYSGTQSGSVAADTDNYTLGAIESGGTVGTFGACEIAAIVAYDEVLTEAQRNSVTAWIKSVYGL